MGRLDQLFVLGGVSLMVAAPLSSLWLGRLLRVDLHDLSWGPTLFAVLLFIHGVVLVGGGVWRWRRRTLLAARRRADVDSGRPDESAKAGTLQQWVLLLGIAAVSLGLRLWKLDGGLWVDEVFTLTDFVRLPLGEIVTRFPSQNQHMFYSVLARWSVMTFGESAWSLRLPAVIFGVLTVWPLFLLGRRLLGRAGALAACMLLTVSYHHVWFSQNARGYSGLLFFAVLATWLWLEARDRGGWWWIGYSASLAGGLWMHQTMLFIVAAHALVWMGQLGLGLWSKKATPADLSNAVNWAPVAAWTLAGTVTLQLYALALPEFFASALHEVSLKSDWTNPIWAITESIRGLGIGWFGIGGVLVAALIGIYAWLGLFRKDAAAALVMVLPAVLGAATMVALGHNIWPRFFFFCAGFAMIILVSGAIELPTVVLGRVDAKHGTRIAQALSAIIVCAMIVVSASTVSRNYALPKQDFGGARDFVEQQRRGDEQVVAVGLAGKVYASYFAPQWIYAEDHANLVSVRDQSDIGLWLVYTLPVEVKAFHPEIWAAISSDFEVVRVFPGTLGGGEVYVCREKAPPNANQAGTVL